MTGGEVVHEVLVRAGVTHVFGVVSVHNLPIYDAIERGGRITPVAMRHEQAAVHAADGYARATGRLGVAVTSTGPGAANGLPGLYEAGFASSPVLMITGQADTPNFGKGRGFVHEADNQAAMLAAVCRRVETVRMRQQIAPALMRVIEDILTGRPQPGSIEIPIDLQYAGREVTPAEQAPVAVPAAVQPDAAAVDAAAALLAGAVRPLIVAGGGVLRSGGAQRPAGASAELRALAELLGAPVLLSANGRGGLADDHPLCLGNLVYHPEIRALREQADVVLAVGTRLQVGSEARNYAALSGKLIHLDADAGVIHRVNPAELAMVADAAAGLTALTAALADRGDRGDRPVARERQAWAERARSGARYRAGAAARPGRPGPRRDHGGDPRRGAARYSPGARQHGARLSVGQPDVADPGAAHLHAPDRRRHRAGAAAGHRGRRRHRTPHRADCRRRRLHAARRRTGRRGAVPAAGHHLPVQRPRLRRAAPHRGDALWRAHVRCRPGHARLPRPGAQHGRGRPGGGRRRPVPHRLPGGDAGRPVRSSWTST